MRAARMFLNEGEKENKKEWGIEIVKHVWRRKIRKKKKKKRNEMYGWNEMRERRNNIENKKS